MGPGSSLGPGVRGHGDFPRVARQGLVAKAGPNTPARNRVDQGAPGAAGGNASPGLWYLPGDGDGPRPGQNVGPLMGLAWWVLWPDRAGFWQSWRPMSYGVTEAGTDSPGGLKWAPEPWAEMRKKRGPRCNL